MKSKLLSSLPKSFYVWFLTPLLTFFVFLSLEYGNDAGFIPLLLTPIIGVIGYAAWVSKTTRYSDGLFLVGAEGCRALYIFIIGFLYLFLFQNTMSGMRFHASTPGIGDALFGAFGFLFISCFFYLVPDAVVGIANLILRTVFPKLSRWTVASILILIGFATYFVSFRGMLHTD